MTSDETLRTSRVDGLGRITLDRPGVALAKEAAHTIQDMEYGTSLRHPREPITLVGFSDDATEGIAAFFARHEPGWTGR